MVSTPDSPNPDNPLSARMLERVAELRAQGPAALVAEAVAMIGWMLAQQSRLTEIHKKAHAALVSRDLVKADSLLEYAEGFNVGLQMTLQGLQATLAAALDKGSAGA